MFSSISIHMPIADVRLQNWGLEFNQVHWQSCFLRNILQDARPMLPSQAVRSQPMKQKKSIVLSTNHAFHRAQATAFAKRQDWLWRPSHEKDQGRKRSKGILKTWACFSDVSHPRPSEFSFPGGLDLELLRIDLCTGELVTNKEYHVMVRRLQFGVRYTVRVQTQVLLCLVIMGKLFHFSGPQFPHL